MKDLRLRKEAEKGRDEINLVLQIWPIERGIYVTLASKLPHDMNDEECAWLAQEIRNGVIAFGHA